MRRFPPVRAAPALPQSRTIIKGFRPAQAPFASAAFAGRHLRIPVAPDVSAVGPFLGKTLVEQDAADVASVGQVDIDQDAPVRVAVVQADIHHYDRVAALNGTYAATRRILDTHLAMSREAVAAGAVDWLLWP